jgi:hypothetical protein
MIHIGAAGSYLNRRVGRVGCAGAPGLGNAEMCASEVLVSSLGFVGSFTEAVGFSIIVFRLHPLSPREATSLMPIVSRSITLQPSNHLGHGFLSVYPEALVLRHAC